MLQDDLQPVARLRALYPAATFHRGAPYQGWWLVPRRTCAEVGSQPYPGLLEGAPHLVAALDIGQIDRPFAPRKRQIGRAHV